MSKKEYPYQNRSLEDMEGEEWDDIPGLDGYFRVSNYGRIKRLRRESPNSKGIVKVYCEKIIAPRVSRTPNTYVSDVTYQLGTHCTVEKRCMIFRFEGSFIIVL